MFTKIKGTLPPAVKPPVKLPVKVMGTSPAQHLWITGLLWLALATGLTILQPSDAFAEAALPRLPKGHALVPFYPAANNGELNLWWHEVKRIARTPAMVSPLVDGFVYSEAYYFPDRRQTQSTLFWVPLPRFPLGHSSLDDMNLGTTTLPNVSSIAIPDAPAAINPKTADPRQYSSWFDPIQTLQRRQAVINVGDGRNDRYFGFDTLTPVDFSYNGQRLLIQRRVGALYVGLRCSDVLLWDKTRGVVETYPELIQALEYQWRQRLMSEQGQSQGSGQPPKNLLTMAWDIEPLGFKQGQDESFYYRAWAYTWLQGEAPKRFSLGLWQYNLRSHSPQMLQINGWESPTGLSYNALAYKYQEPTVVKRYGTEKRPPSASTYVYGFKP